MKVLGWCLIHSDQKPLEFGKHPDIKLSYYSNNSIRLQLFVDVEIIYHEAESCIQIIITESTNNGTSRKNMPVQIVIFIDEPSKLRFESFDVILDFSCEIPPYNTYTNYLLIH
jgi:hypothetical protein